MVSAAEQRLGSVELDGFRLVEILGEGSFGTAYLAEQLGTDRLAVVKIAHPEVVEGARGAHVRARFAAEVRAATRIRHPGLCTVYTFGETAERLPAIAMEYIEGETLRDRLTRLAGRPMPLTELVTCFTQLASVLEAVHRHGVVHRDVNPNNVMLGTDHDGREQVKLVDFGIAMLSERLSGEAIAGTPGYSAPEQFTGKATAASDLFSVGAVLWWAATGWELLGELNDPEDVIATIRRWVAAPDPRAVCPTIPAALARLVRDLLDPTPGFRPSLDEVRMELESLLQPDAAPRQRRVLLIDPTGALASTVGAIFEPYGVRVVTATDPRRAARSEDEFAAVLVSGRLSTPTPSALFHHLRSTNPALPVYVLAKGSEVVFWEEVPSGARVRLPAGAYRLAELGEHLQALRTTARPAPAAETLRGAATAFAFISTGVGPDPRFAGRSPRNTAPYAVANRDAQSAPVGTRPLEAPAQHRGATQAPPAPTMPPITAEASPIATGPRLLPPPRVTGAPRSTATEVSGPAWSAYVGTLPELVLELEERIAGDGDVSSICQQIEGLADAAGVREVVTVTQTLRFLTAAGAADNPASFLGDIEAAYARSIRERAPKQPAPAPISQPARVWSR